MSWQQPPPGQQPPPMGFYPGQQGPTPGFYPGQGYPGQGYPGQSYPGQGYPGGAVPPPYPGQPGVGYPQQGFPGGGVPPFGQGVPPPQGIPFSPPPLHPSSMYGGYNNGDAENPLTDTDGFAFSEKSIRHGFIRKVYGILMIQLSFTVAAIGFFMFHEPARMFVAQNRWLFYVALVMTIVCILVMACCGNVRRKAPMNFIFLGIFTLCESFMLGVATTAYKADAVFLAAIITTGVVLALTIFAFQTKWDFTMMGGMLFAAVVVLFLFGLIAMFFPGKIITLVYASCGAIIFSLYLVYDTQMMMGGKHKYSISPEEYIFAALNLYLDIINIFMYILTIIGASSRD